jgi:hypothetical protein
MAKSGPQRFPGASTTYWYGSKYPGSAMESNVIVWHTTEGTSLPGYGGGAEAPNFTAPGLRREAPRLVPALRIRRLLPRPHEPIRGSRDQHPQRLPGRDRRHLRPHHPHQVEPRRIRPPLHTRPPRLGNPGPGRVREVGQPEPRRAALLGTHVQGVPLQLRQQRRADERQPLDKSFKGHCGHQHVPENDHGDPGAVPDRRHPRRRQGRRHPHPYRRTKCRTRSAGTRRQTGR